MALQRILAMSDRDIELLPLDQLGLLILDGMSAEQQAGSSSNRWNILNEAHNAGRQRSARFLSEALQWLESKGLVAPAGQNSERDWIVVTRRGVEVLTSGLDGVLAAERLDVDLHPRLDNVRRQFLIGEYEMAVLKGLREVEIRIRELSGLDGLVGRALVQQAFGKAGVLRDQTEPPAEQDSLMELLSGALGLFRNPPAHREVQFDDPMHAAEVIITASLLMRLLDHVEVAVASSIP